MAIETREDPEVPDLALLLSHLVDRAVGVLVVVIADQDRR